MDFGQRKLSKECAGQLKRRPIRDVRPFALMMAPAYVFMKLNEKFVMVKGPFDFFTTEELERLSSFESLFFPEEADAAFRFRGAGAQVKAILSRRAGGGADLGPATYEVSDAVMRVLAPLWEPGLEGPSVDPFYVAVFANELCGPPPEDALRRCRDHSVVFFEQAILSSSLGVFLALHLGYCDLAFLKRFRLELMDHVSLSQPTTLAGAEMRELIGLATRCLDQCLAAIPGGRIGTESYAAGDDRASEKLSSRLRHVERLEHV